MTPKEKAKELVNKFIPHVDYIQGKMVETQKANAKQCAIIAVDEIINILQEAEGDCTLIHIIHYHQEVKQEIENL